MNEGTPRPTAASDKQTQNLGEPIPVSASFLLRLPYRETVSSFDQKSILDLRLQKFPRSRANVKIANRKSQIVLTPDSGSSASAIRANSRYFYCSPQLQQSRHRSRCFGSRRSRQNRSRRLRSCGQRKSNCEIVNRRIRNKQETSFTLAQRNSRE